MDQDTTSGVAHWGQLCVKTLQGQLLVELFVPQEEVPNLATSKYILGVNIFRMEARGCLFQPVVWKVKNHGVYSCRVAAEQDIRTFLMTWAEPYRPDRLLEDDVFKQLSERCIRQQDAKFLTRILATFI